VGVPVLAVLLLSFRLSGQLSGDLLLDRAGFVGLVGGTNEVDGHFCFNRRGCDALPAWWNQGRPLFKAGSNHVQYRVGGRR